MQINRLFEIVYILMNKGTVTAKELAEQFEVSQRTIYRDIDALALAGIPVYTSKGKGGGISLVNNFVLNKSLLSAQDQQEILAALHGMKTVQTGDTKQVLDKLSVVFNQEASNWLEVDFTDWNFKNGDVFNQLKTAILQRFVVEFDYYNTQGKHTRRRVEPLQLWFKSTTWYVKAFCLSRNEVRVFKLSRLHNLQVTDTSFALRDTASANLCSMPIEDKAPSVRVVFRISGSLAYRVYDEFDADELEQLPNGDFVVTTYWPEQDWVYSSILSYGDEIEVLEPTQLRAEIRRKALAIAQQYDD